MNQKFTNVKAAAAIAFFWLVVSESVVIFFGAVDTKIAWIPFGLAPFIFGLALAGLNILTSETR